MASSAFGVGAIALIDALGFKRIWERFDAGEVLSKLHGQRDEAERQILAFNREFPQAKDFNLVFQMDFLSDTIVVGVQLATNSTHSVDPDVGAINDDYVLVQRQIALKQCCVAVAAAVAHGLSSEPPLAYRGAIAFGEFAMEQPFIIGPAVDEAARLHEKSDGAFILFCTSARIQDEEALAAVKRLVTCDPGRFDYLDDLVRLDPFNMRMDVPVKQASHGVDGSNDHPTFSSRVLDPLFFIEPPARNQLAARLLTTFDGDETVQAKADNTANLLRALGHQVGGQ